MYCARCKKELIRSRDWGWTVLPGRIRRLPTCRDDRLCYSKSVVVTPAKTLKRVKRVSPKMSKVKELAQRFVS